MNNTPAEPRLETEIAGIRMKNPVMAASGTFGYGPEYAELVDLNKLGAICVKGISLEPWQGNPPPRTFETASGLLNAIGLQNPGVEGFLREYVPFLRGYDLPVIVNIWGRTLEEYGAVAARLDGADGIAGIEINVSCPNIKEGGILFGTDPARMAGVVREVRGRTSLPLITKLSPNVSDIAAMARAAMDAGSGAVSIMNSYPAMAIDAGNRRPQLGNVTGGLTGPAIKPIALKLVFDAYRCAGCPIVGIGGIRDANDAVEFLLAGARAVAVGTASFTHPRTAIEVVDGIRHYLASRGIGDVTELVGCVRI